MFLLAISDLHSRLDSIQALAGKVSSVKVDLIVFCGDFTNEGSLKIAEKALEEFSKICKKVYCIPGNQDSERIIQMLESKKVSIHKKTRVFKDYFFIGLGGGKPVHCFYRVNVGELQAEKFFKENFPKKPEKTIIVSHCPPAGTKLEVTSNGSRLGLKALEGIIKEKQPLLCLCGHVHEAKGMQAVGKTLCYNIGALFEGNALLLEVKNKRINARELVF